MTRQLSTTTHTWSTGDPVAVSTPQSSNSINSSDAPDVGGVKDALLRTVEEDRVWPNDMTLNVGAAAEMAGGGQISDSMLMQPPPPPAVRSVSVGAFEGLFAGQYATPGERTAFGGFPPTTLGRRAGDTSIAEFSSDGSYFTSFGGVNRSRGTGDGFCPLVRRRTFTSTDETSSSSKNEGNSSSGHSGRRVPVSVSEDNMLALLARHPNVAVGHTTSTVPPTTNKRPVEAFDGGGGGAAFSPTMESKRIADGSDAGVAKAGWDTKGNEVMNRARRNSFIMRWV